MADMCRARFAVIVFTMHRLSYPITRAEAGMGKRKSKSQGLLCILVIILLTRPGCTVHTVT